MFLCYHDLRTPWYAKVFAALVVAYAFSPIDLIPDFIPILGYLDDLILLPIGIWLALRMIPEQVKNDARKKTLTGSPERKPKTWLAVLIIFIIWLGVFIVIIFQACRLGKIFLK